MLKAKYQKHTAAQYQQILQGARALFVEQGIERVNFSAVAARCGIARTTLYKYFPDKESLLWAIQHQAFSSLGLALRARQAARPLTALERFAAYFEELVCRFELDPDFIRFLDLFEKTYQTETARRRSDIYNKMFHPGDFGSGDTVRFLCENFHDGSLRPELDPHTTAVSATYTALYALIGFSKDRAPLLLKYGVAAPGAARFLFDCFLRGISADGSLPAGAR